jgi:excisionase family DNA binding protein
MDELLTARQVQDLLKVDRTTIYRMLDDGRLTGVKVGQQWRFHRAAIESMMEGKPLANALTLPMVVDVLPIHCLQPVQDVFAEVLGIGAVTTAPDGEPLTEISNPCQFCQLILASETERAACIASWRKLAQESTVQPHFVKCHAGLQYARARIETDGALAATLVAGQFYADEPNAREETKRVHALAQTHRIDENKLRAAAHAVPRLDEHKRSEIGHWLERVAQTFEQIGSERANLLARLKQIAAMSMFEAPATN